MNQKGFTLVELAIVLVIIGVILGGVIKGQELVNNAKLQKVYREYQQVEFATYSYFDRYNDYPGDRQSTTPDGDITFGENDDFWTEVRAEGFFVDGETGTTKPTHALDGQIVISNGALGTIDTDGTTVVTAALGNSVCFSDLTRAQAESLDAKFDDGEPDTGKVRAGEQATAGTVVVGDTTSNPLTDYTDDTLTYITCIDMEQ